MSCAYCPSVCLLWRNVYLGLLPIFQLGCLVFCYWTVWAVYICILKINPLSVASFANIFSQSKGCLFVLFVVSFAVQKLISLIRSHLFIFAYFSIALGDWPKKTLVRFLSENVLHMFSSSSFMMSCLIFNFEFILNLFLCMVWRCVLTSLIYLQLSNFSTPLAEETVFSPLYILASFVED